MDPVDTPDLAAYRQIIAMGTPELVAALAEQLGLRLTAYLGRVEETRTVRQWSEGTREITNNRDADRLRLALHVATMMGFRESADVVRAWFQGLNPFLGDVSPARMLREGDLAVVGPRILAAARQFRGAG
ncbi:hypothetical protein [Mycobacteroides abscessus]|uniref:hypothetical protein n=1 Tax=Mycobacteroides abscessus TaxID=36809 RepID=UPI000C25A440|nr:hypothetical protein [Mycobacteroides abscessus]